MCLRSRTSIEKRIAATLLSRSRYSTPSMFDFARVNAVMAEYFSQPYPARSTIQAAALPRGAAFEVDGVMVLD